MAGVGLPLFDKTFDFGSLSGAQPASPMTMQITLSLALVARE